MVCWWNYETMPSFNLLRVHVTSQNLECYIKELNEWLFDWVIEIEWKFETFWNFWMRGNKMTFPFCFWIQFHPNSNHGEKMTWLLQNKGFEKWIWKFLKIFNLESISYLALFWNSKEFRFTCLKFQNLRGGIWPSKPGAFLWNIWTLKPRGLFEKYLQKKQKQFRHFLKNDFF